MMKRKIPDQAISHKDPLFRILLARRHPAFDFLIAFGIAVVCLGLSWESGRVHNGPIFLAPLSGILIASIFLGGGPALFCGMTLAIGLDWILFWPTSIFPDLKIGLLRIAIFFIAAVILGRTTALLREGYLQAEALKEETAKLAAARQQIVDVVSHDLRNPIASVQMYASLLLTKTENQSLEINEGAYLKGILRSTGRMKRITNDLLDASQIETARFTMNLFEEPLEPIIFEALDSFKTLAQERNIHFKIEPAIPSICLHVDRCRIVQAVSNLLHNAVKFSPDNGSILIDVKQTEDLLRITVSDEGVGIEPEKMPRIFDRYWTDQISTHGNGLGLFIAKGIAQSHHGDLTVTNTPKGGASFTLTIPIESTEFRVEDSVAA
jgi:signal transduction histidine kinase